MKYRNNAQHIRPVPYSTVRSLVLFYRRHGIRQSHDQRFDTVLWQQIFFWFYQRAPQDPAGMLILERCQYGDHDPLWDKLFGARGALRANDVALALIERQRSKRQEKLVRRILKAA